jgi:UDP-N-acetylmuramate dehydrogenase
MPQHTDSTTPLVEGKPLHTSWRVGGTARYYAEAADSPTLLRLLQWGEEQAMPVLLLGGGTNLLIRDSGFNGLVIHYTAREWRIINEEQATTALLTAEAGVPIGRLVWMLGAQGWANLEWAAGLPGSIGGAIYGNAGCYGGDIASVLVQAQVIAHGAVQTWSNADMAFGYRTSRVKQQRVQQQQGAGDTPLIPTIILSGTFQLERREKAELVQRMKQVASQRKEKTPAGHSCGSVFKNPSTSPLSAGQLIEQAGLKGTRRGGAEISPKHANYIVNTGNASADDILYLIDLAQNQVMQQFGIALELEVQIVG